MIDQVAEFHEKFGLPNGTVDLLAVDAAAARFRITFMREELTEFTEDLSMGNRVGAFDALLDLAYVVYGTALFMGVTPEQWKEGMNAVHQCNMKKVRVEREEQSKRGSAFDVKKPEGWVGPEDELGRILG